MKAPLSWLKDFVEINIPITELAHRMTMAGLEVEAIKFVGLPVPKEGSRDAGLSGYEWDREKLVVASILEVMSHPNADRLVLCRLNDGQQEHIVLTGAPNLFEFKGRGPLPEPIKVAYAREGAQIYDGHAEGLVLTTLKRAKIRGVDSYSMVCSEKELGISEDHEGIIVLDEDAPVGAPLVDYMGDAVLEVSILPSTARCASILGLAREIAALTGKTLNKIPEKGLRSSKESVDFAHIEISNPELNPRFMLGLLCGAAIYPSPYKVQLRLKLAGMRPINNIVDATNYAMLELGEPLHAFDYDALTRRARGKPITIKTRTAKPGEKLTTLDGEERELDGTTVLVCDSKGPLSIAGVMGGAETEIGDGTTNILLEAAAWNFINIRKTARRHNLPSEASYRFSRGVHPAMVERGLKRGLQLMQAWSGGQVAPGFVDEYPLPVKDPRITLTPADVKRWLGISLSAEDVASLLRRLEFTVGIKGDILSVKIPDHRLDIGEGVTGKADVIEEIARIHGYDNIPESRMTDGLPPQMGNPLLDKEEKVRDLLALQGLQEIINYRFTTPEREARRLPTESPKDDKPYVRLVNPISADKVVMRHSLLAGVLENAESNSRQRDRLALFEIGPVFLTSEAGDLPDELQRLSILLAGQRSLPSWQGSDQNPMDFFDLKGSLDTLFENLHVPSIHYETAMNPSFHPGKCARILSNEKQLGIFGEIHPQVRERYGWPVTWADVPILAADLDMDALLALMPERFDSAPVPEFPPVLEDLAIVVGENIPAGHVAELIKESGGRIISQVRLFDVYRGEKIGLGKKSLAYSLTYQAPGKTLSDKDVAGIRTRILRRLEQELDAKLRE